MDRRAFIGTMAALLYGSGCAGPDRIDRTTPTVDVTGLGEGAATAAVGHGTLQLRLEQEGSRVQGSIRNYWAMGACATGERIARRHRGQRCVQLQADELAHHRRDDGRFRPDERRRIWPLRALPTHAPMGQRFFQSGSKTVTVGYRP